VVEAVFLIFFIVFSLIEQTSICIVAIMSSTTTEQSIDALVVGAG
jgi:hypothetical protein